ncbi:MAG: filamentous hemagglutinin family outer membrane protein [Betaproteobacteria bacterium]|nr:filamentous hemagglutinin family outer membrane protein [Betaproteobacteria bacterium]
MKFNRTRISQALAAALGAGFVPYSAAQVVRDGTMGPSGAIAATPISSPRYTGEFRINASDGQQRGGNLFFSFSQFDVAANRQATFLGPGDVTNIISRVTGGAASFVFGGLKSEIAGANLFLINPQGIFFGQNASLDVSGSFYASTAHYVALGASGRFDTTNAAATVLTSAPPSAFGFVGPPAAIIVDRSQLRGAPGAGLTIAGGTLQISGGSLTAPGGILSLASVAGAGEVRLAGSEAVPNAGVARGSIELTNGAALDASAPAGIPGGKVVIRGGMLTLQNASAGITNNAAGSAEGVIVDATESVSMTQGSAIGAITLGSGSAGPLSVVSPTLTMSASAITSQSRGPGPAGPVNVQTNRATLTAGSYIDSTATAAGPAGDVTVTALESLDLSGSGADGFPTNIKSVSIDAGRGGNVLIASADVRLDGGAIVTNVLGTGAGGDIGVYAERISMVNGARIDSSSFAAGASGSITVAATESIMVAGDGTRSTGIGSSAYARGAGGNIQLSAPVIDLTRATVNSSSDGAGVAGNIAIAAHDLAASLSVIDASATGAGAAGNIAIEGARIVIKDNSQVNSSAVSSATGRVSVVASESITLTRGTGDPRIGDTGLLSITSGATAGGAMVVAAPSITLDAGVIRTRSFGAGAAGDISVQAERLAVVNGGQIDSSAFAAGRAGNLMVDASASVVVSGHDTNGRISGLFTASVDTGAGGDMIVRSPVVNVTGALISADGLSTGSPGNITVEAGKVALSGGGAISSSSRAPGAGSTVKIAASESFSATGADTAGNRSAVVGTNDGAGAGTAILITTPAMTLDGGGITTATAGAGAGGSITIGADRVALTNGGQISSNSSGTGRSGDVNITATESISMSGTFAGQPAGIFARALAAGDGGAVSLTAPVITLDGAAVNVGTQGSGAAGNIIIAATQLMLANGAELDSSTSARGSGGKIDINALQSVTVSGRNATQQSAITSTASAVGSAGEVHIVAPGVTIDGGVIGGDTSGSGTGGSITIDASRLALRNQGQIVSTTAGAGDAGRITVMAAESVTITSTAATLADSGLFGISSGKGRGGDIDITAPVVNVTGGSIAGSALGAGSAGNISVHGVRVNVTAGGAIDSSSLVSGDAGRVLLDAAEAIDISGSNTAGNTSRVTSVAAGSGHGGEVFLRAPLVTIDQAKVRTDATGNGIAGQISVEAARLTLTHGGQLSSSATDDAVGGKVTVTASEALTITDAVADLASAGLFAATLGVGRGGEIAVSAPLVSVEGGAISTTTFGAGNAGRIGIQARSVALAKGGFIDSSSTGGSGAAGVMTVTASEAIAITGRDANGIPSTISSRTAGAGNGGDILLSAPTVTVDGAIVRVDASGRGSAGRIGIAAERLAIMNGGQLASGTGGAGSGGTLNVTATESILITGSNSDVRSRIINSSAGSGNAGEIFLSAPRISLENGGFVNGNASSGGAAGSVTIRGGTLSLSTGEISTSTTQSGRGGAIDIAVGQAVTMTGSVIKATSAGSGDAGNIVVDAGRSLTMVSSAISTEANRADGGNIEINAIDLLRLTDSRITTSVGNGLGNGGNITIDPTFVVLDGSQIIANAFGGNGGNIDITTDALLRSGDSVIQASSQLGVQGTIRISAPDSDLAGGLTPLAGGLFDPSLLLRESCSARAGRGGNSFVGVGHGGLPERPGSLAFSSYTQAQYAPGGAQLSAPLFALARAFESACAQ